MKSHLHVGLCILAVIFLFLQGTDAFWGRRRRRRAPPPPQPKDTTPPAFNVQCPISLGNFRTSTIPFPVTWSEPTALDNSKPAHVERLGSGPGTSFSEGYHNITYQTSDQVPNYSYCSVEFEVTLIKCSPISHLDRGYVACTEGTLVGSSCRYACFQGYKIAGGTAERVCTENRRTQTADWSGSQPRCVERDCSPDVVSLAPEKGSVSCTQRNRFQSVCSYSCDEGYTIPPGHTRDRVCTSQGWTGSLPVCQDTTGPSFEDCPLSQIIYADDQQETGSASWSQPTVIDNSGAAVIDITHDGPSPGAELPQGHYVITYTARDEDENEGTCIFTITVQVIRCSTLPITPGLIVSCQHGNLRGSTCYFSCSRGYRLQGVSSSTCQRNGFSGEWTSQPPACEELHCTSLEPPENGLYLNGRPCPTSYGSSCYFDCLPGFYITNNVLHCTAQTGSDEAFWEGDPPSCEVETCDRPNLGGPLEVPDNSSVCSSDVQIPAGMECEFECSEGYFLQGDSQATCGLSGSWEHPLPTCKAVTCIGSNLPVPLHGGKSGCPRERELFGTVCTLFCDVGYETSEVTPVRRVCQDDGQGDGVWSGGPISCSIVQCLPLDIPSNGYVESCRLTDQSTDITQRQDYGTTCIAHCNQGYTPLGTTTRRCMANGQWDGVLQTCVDLTAPSVICPPDTVFYAEPGRSLVKVPWEQFEPVQASDAGLMIPAYLESIDSDPIRTKPTTLSEGEHILVYRATDAAGNTDTCSFELQVKVVRCPPIYTPSNGHVTLLLGQGSCDGGAVLGSACQVTCDHGYDLPNKVEHVTLMCESNEEGTNHVGSWNGSTPLCQVARCEVQPSANSSVRGCPFEVAVYGDQCEFVCDDGYLTYQDGLKRVTRVCTENGTFSGDDFICDAPVTCPSGFSLQHGTVTPAECTTHGDRLPYGTSCNFHCGDGFLQYGPFVKTCGADGSWTNNRVVFCEDRQEPTFDEACPRYINVNADRGSLHTTVDFEIPHASDNSGNVTVKLVPGLPGPNDTFSEGTTVTSYVASDASGNSVRCQIDVNVQVFRCPRPQAPARGSLINCTDPIYGSECSYACNHGYELLGSSTRTCELTQGQAPASWSGEQPSCRPRTCPALSTPTLAIRSGCHQDPPGEENFGTLCTFYCPYGFQGIGDHQKRCQADGTWSGSEFSCQAVACEPLGVVLGSTISPTNCQTDPRFGETCLLRCDTPGFQIQPRVLSDTVCLGTGLWSRNITQASCVDIEAPVFTMCPNDFITYASEGELLADVTWDVQATDNNPTAATNILCDMEQGLVPEGDYAVTCTASDQQGNMQTCFFEISVRVRRCQPLLPPVFGHVIASCDNLWGSECAVDCAIGYSLVGPSQTHCNYTGQGMRWERETTPHCDIVGCSPLNLPLDISVYPATCTSLEKLYYGTECTFFCRNGLTFEGAVPSVSCSANGEWDADVETIDLRCIDELAPTLMFCPGPISVTRTEVWGVEVTFDLPRAEDNADEVLTVSTYPENLTSPFNFTEDAVASFIFTDSAGNNVTCSFSIYVQDEIAPIVVFCPADIQVNTSEVLTEVTWKEPIFEEVTGDELLISSNHDNHMASFPWGEHVVSYLVTNADNGKTVGCEFSIAVTPVTCNDLGVPGNGALSCDQWAYGRFCSILCNEHFDIPRLPSSRQPPEHYVCGGSGLWSPHAYVPDCSAIRRPGRINLPNELLYFSGDCGSQETLNQIADAFIAVLQSTDFSDVCSHSDQCTTENVRVTCGPNVDVRRRGRRDISHRRPSSSNRAVNSVLLDADQVKRRLKRQADSPFVVSIEWDFALNINQDPSLGNFDAATEAEDIMISMNDILYEQILDGSFPDINNIDGVNITLDTESLTFNYAEVICDDGFTADNNDLQCVPCVAGTFFDNVTNVCQACPRGSYQDSEGQTSCNPCEEGKWTEEEGSTNITQCLDICEAGHFSSVGVVPCKQCAIGTYQPLPLSTSCLQCPNGTTTSSLGSIQIQQCMEPCPSGASSLSGFVPCEPCQIGSYQNLEQQTSCDPCPGQLSTINTGSQSVQDCTDINECASHPCQNGATCVDLTDSYQCICPAGYSGQNCEINIDECSLYQPCLHNGSCVDRIDAYSCVCLPGFTGVECEQRFDLCQSSPCQNNGTCFSSATLYQCQCLPGYHGNDCEMVLHPCSPNPCINGATCTVLEGEDGGYRCTCLAGFSGLNCSRDINECHSNPCLHGGSCKDMVNDFLCSCPTGYEGSVCEVDIDLCSSQPCQNNGSCFDLVDTFECLCQEGYAGTFCERSRNACDDYPCLNGGICQTEDGANHIYMCECRPGFIGRDCEVNQDDCSSSPCSNGATCMDGVDNYTCICTDDFTGPTCDENLDQCSGNPCGPNTTCVEQIVGYQCLCPPGRTGLQCLDMVDFCDIEDGRCFNGGTCINEEETFSCQCVPGFQGSQCEIEIDECASEPCFHGSTCLNLIGNYSCVCPLGFSGPTCEENIDDCLSSPCVNGTCQDGLNSWSCDCYHGYQGDVCDIPVDFCLTTPCFNNGVCASLQNDFMCTCLSGFTGETCEVNIDECASFPCIQGSCIDDIDGYRCQCDGGFTGIHCEIDLDECIIDPCLNLGTCIDRPRGYTCQCLQGFEGLNCEVNIDDCVNNDCQNNATCIDSVDSYNCSCTPGYSGLLCQLQITPACSSHPCANGGSCVEDDDVGFYCDCLEGFIGRTCENDTDDCIINGCQNGATCLDQVDSYICQCLSGFNGTFCELNIDECTSQPCLHNATCIDDISGFRCQCSNGYTGEMCEMDIDECESNPCLNRGSCEDTIGGYICHCDAGFRGPQCNETSMECESQPCLNGATCIEGFTQFVCDCAPGYTGLLCETTLPSDFDVIFDPSAKIIHLTAMNSSDINHMTISVWVRIVQAPQDFSIFTYLVGDEEFSLVNPCSLKLISKSTSYNIGSSLCDNAWHYVRLIWTFEPELVWSLSIDQDNIAYRNDTMPSSRDLGPGSILVGSENMEQKDYVIMSAFNVWGSKLDAEDLEAVSLTCQPALFGDIVSWTDMVSSENISSRQIESPSMCDAVDECMSSPCMYGSCENKLDGFHCECELGYKGDLCTETQDLCSDGLCKNGASCQTVEGTPVCQCREGFSGRFCETSKVDGGWSNWSPWSECSSTCGSGTRSRTRECTNPAPQGGGLNCTGKMEQDGSCNTFKCPGCLRLRRPLRGYLHCDDKPDFTNCTISCRRGYGFAERALDSYFCGKDTNYRWNHQTGKNRRALLPSCTELSQSYGSTGVLEVGFPGAVCTSTRDRESLTQAAYRSLNAHSQDIDCLTDGTCTVLRIQVENCQLQTNRRRSVRAGAEVKIGFAVYQNASTENQTDIASDNFTETASLEPLDIFYLNMSSLLMNDSLTLVIDDQVLHSDPSSIKGDILDNCPPGYIDGAADGFCVPCGIGTYHGIEGNDTESECHPCPKDTYQDEEGQIECILCPSGTFTDSQHTSNSTDCKAPTPIPTSPTSPPVGTTIPPAKPDHFPLPLICGATTGGIIILTIILVIIGYCRHKQRSKTGSKVAQDIQMLNTTKEGRERNNYDFVYNHSKDEGTTNHGFVFGSDDIPSLKEKMDKSDTDDSNPKAGYSEYPTIRVSEYSEEELKVYLPPETPSTFGTKVQVEEKL